MQTATSHLLDDFGLRGLGQEGPVEAQERVRLAANVANRNVARAQLEHEQHKQIETQTDLQSFRKKTSHLCEDNLDGAQLLVNARRQEVEAHVERRVHGLVVAANPQNGAGSIRAPNASDRSLTW